MGAETDQAKGKVKEVVGTLTGDKDLEAEGKADRLASEAKEKIDEVKVKVDEVVDKTKEAMHRK
jgi:uncharacterized protein YjbJ (UPF0337 family)